MTLTRKGVIENLLPLLLGALAFFLIVGPRALYPSNLAWLGLGDPATHYLGWLFFRVSDWSFPIGMNPDYGLEMSNAILFSDSIPLFAFLFKPFDALLPATFQYFGLWLLTCFSLQALFGWKLGSLISDSPAIRALCAGLFLISPPMIWRLHGHMSLLGHFLILAALYLTFHPGIHRRKWAWGTVLVAASLVHAYLLAMVGALWLADMTGRTIKKTLSGRAVLLEGGILLSAVIFACWQAGYFTVGSGAVSGGFGLYRMNLLSIFDSSGWSYILRDLPEAGGDYEGFNFLGLGSIFLLICSLPLLFAQEGKLGEAVRNSPALFLVLLGFTLFALSNNIGFASLELLEYPLPEVVIRLANIFRSSGRMFWPVYYAIIFAIIYLVVHGNSKRVAISLMTLALVLQVTDTRAGWKSIRERLMSKPTAALSVDFASPHWQRAIAKYEKVRWLPTDNHSPKWLPIAFNAGKSGLATDAVYLARVDRSAHQQARAQGINALQTGIYEADSLYFLDDSVVLQAASSLDQETDVLARVSGFNILAPGWRNCKDCPAFENEVKLSDLLPKERRNR